MLASLVAQNKRKLDFFYYSFEILQTPREKEGGERRREGWVEKGERRGITLPKCDAQIPADVFIKIALGILMFTLIYSGLL